jgi:capsular exopolysaccharide synthesis family protein
MTRQRDVVDVDETSPLRAEDTRLSDLYASIVELFRRRYLVFLVVLVVVLGTSLTLISLVSAKYDATARVRIDPSRNPLASQRDSNAGLSDEAIDTEVTELSSRDLAREVARRVDMSSDPGVSRAVDALAKTGKTVTIDERLNAISDVLLGGLDVRREKLTYIIAVRYRSRNPQTAARLANAFAETYIATRVGGRASTAQTQAATLEQQVRQLEIETRAAENRVAQFRVAAGIVQGGALGTIADQQVAPISTQLASAQSEAAEARAKLAEARRQVRSGGLDSVSEVRSSPVVADLRRQRAEVVRNMGEINARYGPRHPETIKVTEQLEAIDSQIRDEANRALGSLQAQADAASARAASLTGTLEGLKAQQSRNTSTSAVAEGYERDAATKRTALEKATQQQLEAQQSANNNMANAVIVDRAQVPSTPASPNRPLLAVIAGMTALALGVGVITTQELLGVGMRSISEVESRLNIPVLGSIPRVAKRHKGVLSPAALVVEQPASLFAESLRNIRTSVLGVGPTVHSVVGFTSSLPEEGKTTTSLAFARILAMNGTRTLLIDCDLRKASIRDLVHTTASDGIVEVLQGSVTSEGAIIADEVPGLDLLLAKQRLFTAEDLFGTGKMRDVLAELRKKYQTIVLDLPPVMGVADARALAVLSDTAVMVSHWGTTPRRAVEQALNRLRNDGANVVGLVFTMVDPRSEAIGGLFYSQKYAAYYQRD